MKMKCIFFNENQIEILVHKRLFRADPGMELTKNLTISLNMTVQGINTREKSYHTFSFYLYAVHFFYGQKIILLLVFLAQFL